MEVFYYVKKLVNRFFGLFPTSLPQGREEFERWAFKLVNTWDLPTDSVRDIKFMLSTVIMHLGPQVARKPDYYFILTIRAAAAKQVSASVFQEIKTQQIEENKKANEAAAAPKTEVTHLKAVTSNEPQK